MFQPPTIAYEINKRYYFYTCLYSEPAWILHSVVLDAEPSYGLPPYGFSPYSALPSFLEPAPTYLSKMREIVYYDIRIMLINKR